MGGSGDKLLMKERKDEKVVATLVIGYGTGDTYIEPSSRQVSRNKD